MTRIARAWPLLMVLLLLVPSTGGQGTDPLPDVGPDLAVAQITVIGPDPVWTDGEATGTRIHVTVTNVGGAPSAEGYILTYEWMDGGEANPLNGEFLESFDVHPSLGEEPVLEPGQSRSHEIDWNLQPGQEGDVPVRVTIFPLGANARTDNDQAVQTVFVADRHVVLEPLDSEGTIPLRPHETRFVRIHVTNMGNQDQTARITVTEDAQQATTDLEATLLPAEAETPGLPVPAGQTVTATLFVKYNFAGEKDPEFSIPYSVGVETGYGSVLQDTTPAFTFLDEDMTDGSPATLQYLGPTPLSMHPGDAAAAQLRLTNTGDEDDTYAVSASIEEAGWDLNVDTSQVALGPGESQTLTVTATAPSEANAVLGAHAALAVSFRSDRDAVLQKPTTDTLVPLQIHGPSIVLSAGNGWPAEPYAGEAETYPVVITNQGDRATVPNGTVTLRVTDPDGTVTKESVTVEDAIAPGGKVTVTFDLDEVFPDQDGTMRVTATWTSAEGRSISTEDLVIEMLLHAPDIAIDPPTSLSGMAGERVGYRATGHVFLVHNNGDASETLRLQLTAAAGDAVLAFDRNTLSLEAGETRSVPFDHVLPAAGDDLTNDRVTLQATIAGRDGRTWSSDVATTITDSLPPSIEQAGAWTSVTSVGADLSVQVDIMDDSSVQTVNVTHTDPSGAATDRPLANQGGGRWTASVSLDAVGDHTFTVNAVDIHGNTGHLALPKVVVDDIPAPELALSFGGDRFAVNASEPFHVQVTDDRAVVVGLRIEWSGNGTLVEERPVELDDSGAATFNLTGIPSGNLTVTVQAINDAGGIASQFLTVTLTPSHDTTSGEEDGSEGDSDDSRGIPGPALWVFLTGLLPFAKRRRDDPVRSRSRRRRFRVPPARAGGRAAALAAAAILVAGTVFAAVGPLDMTGAGNAVDDASEGGWDPADPRNRFLADRDADLAASLDRLWAGLPEPLHPVTAMGPAAGYVFEAGPDAPRLRAAPESASDLMGRLVGPDADPLPIPSPPQGDEPLLSAIQDLVDLPGVEDPGQEVLRTQIAALRLVPEAEAGLAQLVLAYGEAIRLEEEALRGLTPVEQRLLAGDDAAWAAWHARDPQRSAHDRADLMQDLRGRIDMARLLQATDLLIRTAEAVKDTISLPPGPVHAPARSAATATTPDRRAGALASALDPEADGDGSPWAMLQQIVGATSLEVPSPLPDLPDEDLATALQSLAITLGVPQSEVSALAPSVDLPPSLADAVAGIVTARWVGLTSGDAHTHTLLLLDAMERAEPTLRAWSAVLAMQTDVAAPDAKALLHASLAPGATPSMFLQGEGPDGSAPGTPSLADLLTTHGLTPIEAAQAVAALPSDAASAVATAWTGLDALEDARRTHGPAIEDARQQAATVSNLLRAPAWTSQEAAQVQAWAETDRQAGLEAQRAVAQARMGAMRAVESAVAALEGRTGDVVLPDPVDALPDAGGEDGSWWQSLVAFVKDFQIIGTASAQPLPEPTLCLPSPVSDCDADVLFYTAEGGGILVTGPGETTIGPFGTGDFDYTQPPRIIIDLGGDDTYLIPAGVAHESRPTSLVIDVGGDDHYRSDDRLAHGVGVGPGTLGVLWDLSGDDHYEHVGAGGPSAENMGQGVGHNGGIGVLVDGSGTDRYEAPRSLAHGATGMDDPQELVVPVIGLGDVTVLEAMPEATALGILLDQGAGDDVLIARTGQGYAGAQYSIAVLVNENGKATYDAQLSDARFQGGVGQEATGAFAALVDLGGDGTTYSSDALPESAVLVANNTEDRRRQDDAAWVIQSSAGVGVGVDSTPRDEDGDGVPDVVELIGGTDIINNPPPPPDPDNLFPITLASLTGTSVYRPDPDDGCNVALDNREAYHFLYITGPTDDIIDVAAHVLIDLGGNDTYLDEVAGPGRYCLGQSTGTTGDVGNLRSGGSIAWDLDGNDRYDTAGLDSTQGAIDSGGVLSGGMSAIDVDGYEVDRLTPVSLLLETGGNDVYRAFERSQGSASGLGYEPLSSAYVQGAAWLMDMSGDDDYGSERDSQGFSEGASGIGALIDLAGDDMYEFTSQGRLVTPSDEVTYVGSAFFIDRAGRDHYRSNDELKDPLKASPAEMFRDQGSGTGGMLFLCTTQTSCYTGDSQLPISLFVDEGPDQDVYLRLDNKATRNYTDVSDLKNNQVRIGASGAIGNLEAAGSNFLDGAACATAGNTTAVACTDTGNIDFGDSDGDGAANFIEFLFGTNATDPNDHPGTLWGDPTRIDGPELWLDIRNTGGLVDIGRGGLAIGGHSDNAYTRGPYDFVVDLGGSDLYNFTDAGNGMFILDAGRNGTDVDIYEPTGTGPSLGAPNGTGIAILLDNGGTNRFWSAGNVTQGAAAAPGGVGVLVTWNASNHFFSEGGAPPSAMVPSAVQGAGVDGGVGVLASFGRGDDIYHAAKHAPWVVDFPVAAQGAANGPGSVGVLLDGGGRNQYLAPDAEGAQGAASGTGAVGILWAGDGNDLYTASDASQASSREGGVGVLIEPGGDDVYRAGAGVQGASDGGVSLLIDLGGYDAYHAAGEAQGHATDSGIALLLDLHGDDDYNMNAEEGQGHGCGALLLDADGQDDHTAAHPRNDHWWTEPSDCNFPTGIDSAGLEEAFQLLADLASRDAVIKLEMEVDGDPLASFESTDDRRDLVLRTRISELDGPEDVRRVTYHIDDTRFAEGMYVGTQQGDLIYEHRTTITHGLLPDGNHEVVAVVVPESTQGADPAVGTPDLPARKSNALTLRVDSAPEPEITLSSRYASSTSESLLTINLDRDADTSTPAANSTVEGCNVSGEPGGHVNVTAVHWTDASIQHVLFDDYCHAGPFTLDVGQMALDGDWSEAIYNVVVEVEDHLGPTVQIARTDLATHVDLRAPSSWIPVDFVGTPDLNETGERVLVPWNSTDSGGGSGVADVFIVQVDGQGEAIGQFGPLNRSGHLRFPATPTIQVIDLVPVAVDYANNTESPCMAGEDPLSFFFGTFTSCYQHRMTLDGAHRVIVDLEPPTVSEEVHASAQVVHPDDDITYTVQASDQNVQGQQTLDKVLLHIDDRQGIEMTPVGGGLYSLTMKHGNTYADREVTYKYRAVAHDKAGNTATTFPGIGTIDGLAPRINPISTTYAVSGEEGPAGIPGGTAKILLDVRDQSGVASVSLDITALNRSQSDQIHDCAASPTQVEGLWECEVPLAPDVVDGVYQVPIRAEDPHGNANTEKSLEMIISTSPLPITDLDILEVDHQGFTLQWTTNTSSTSGVQHSLNNWPADEDPAGNLWPPEDAADHLPDPGDLRKVHSVRVDGLQPANTYHYRAVSESGSGVFSNSTIRQVTLPNSYTFDLDGFGPDAVLGGQVLVQYDLTLLGGTQPADVQMFLQDTKTSGAQRQAVTLPFAQEEVEGATTWIDTRARQVDGTLIFDGTYRLIVELSRFGADFMTVISDEFRIDNQEPLIRPHHPRPGATVNATWPAITVFLEDPGGPAPSASDVSLRVDGEDVAFDIDADALIDGGIRRVVLAPKAETPPLGHGLHTFNVSVTDRAGNLGRVEWQVSVDARPPTGDVEVVMDPGPERVRPGDRIEVKATLIDDTSVAQAWLDLTAAGGGLHPMLSVGDGQWTVGVDLPEDAPEGTHAVSVEAKDGLDNRGTVAVLNMTVDATPPTVTANPASVSYTNATILVTSDEPTRVRAANGTWTSWSTDHAPQVTGLVPGATQEFTVEAIDLAGNVASVEVQVETRADQDPPTAPGSLTAVSPRDDTVTLAWAPATDNAGVSHYVVERVAADRSPPMRTNTTGTTYTDPTAPAGREATYRVVAVDVAGLSSSPAEVTVAVHATPLLLDASVTPDQGAATSPFRVRVDYVHPSGDPADQVQVRVGTVHHDLARLGDAPCHTGCPYAADILLPPTSQVAATGDLRFIATHGGQQAELVVVAPLVTGGHVTVHDGADSVDTPGPGFLAVIALLGLAAAFRSLPDLRRPRP